MNVWSTIKTYAIHTLCVCFVVLMTRMELEQVSEVADAAKPMTADRSRRFGRSSYCKCGWQGSSARVLAKHGIKDETLQL